MMEADTPQETAAPGDWQITNDTAIEPVEEEKQTNEDEESLPPEILTAIEEYDTVMEQVYSMTCFDTPWQAKLSL